MSTPNIREPKYTNVNSNNVRPDTKQPAKKKAPVKLVHSPFGGTMGGWSNQREAVGAKSDLTTFEMKALHTFNVHDNTMKN